MGPWRPPHPTMYKDRPEVPARMGASERFESWSPQSAQFASSCSPSWMVAYYMPWAFTNSMMRISFLPPNHPDGTLCHQPLPAATPPVKLFAKISVRKRETALWGPMLLPKVPKSIQLAHWHFQLKYIYCSFYFFVTILMYHAVHKVKKKMPLPRQTHRRDILSSVGVSLLLNISLTYNSEHEASPITPFTLNVPAWVVVSKAVQASFNPEIIISPSVTTSNTGELMWMERQKACRDMVSGLSCKWPTVSIAFPWWTQSPRPRWSVHLMFLLHDLTALSPRSTG